MSAAERGSSGALLALKITYEKGSALVRTEYNIRKVLGTCTAKLTCADGTEQTDVTMLPSAFFAITKQGDGGMVLYGGGYGHGLGMRGIRSMPIRRSRRFLLSYPSFRF